MSRRVKRSTEFYAAAVRGVSGFPGLRAFARGFDASDGFNLNQVESWTKAQRAKVTRYWNEYQRLTAQSKKVYRPRNKDNLKAAQLAGGHEKGFKFKVAFLPAETDNAKVKITKAGVVIQEQGYTRHLIEFDQRALAKDHEKEVKRAIAQAPAAKSFQIIAGQNVIMSAFDKTTLPAEIGKLMAKYDGRTPLPMSSGNFGDRPKSHHWKLWLAGVQAYEFPKSRGRPMLGVIKRMERRNAQRRKERRAMRGKINRKRRG